MKDLKHDFAQSFEFFESDPAGLKDSGQLCSKNVEGEITNQISVLHQPLIQNPELLGIDHTISNYPRKKIHQFQGNRARISTAKHSSLECDLNRTGCESFGDSLGQTSPITERRSGPSWQGGLLTLPLHLGDFFGQTCQEVSKERCIATISF